MSNAKQSSGPPAIVGIIVGAVLMFGGFWFSKNVKLEFIKTLEAQGIPLDPGKTISIIGVLLILFPVIKFFFIAPLAEAIQNRTTELERTFGEAENLRAEMTQMKQDYERRLVQTEADAREQIQGQIKEAQSLRQQMMAEAGAKAEELKASAAREIEAQKQQAIAELRHYVVELALQATEKLVEANVDEERNRKLVADFLETVEAPR